MPDQVCVGALQGDVWSALVPGLAKKGVLYAYRVDGPGGWETGYRCLTCVTLFCEFLYRTSDQFPKYAARQATLPTSETCMCTNRSAA